MWFINQRSITGTSADLTSQRHALIAWRQPWPSAGGFLGFHSTDGITTMKPWKITIDNYENL